MIAEIGHFSLILAFVLSLVQSLSFIKPQYSTAILYNQFFVLTLAFISSVVCFVTLDFSLVTVAANTNSELPLLYRIGAVWGHHEGSFLLWLWLLVAWMFILQRNFKDLPKPYTAAVISVMAWVVSGLMFCLLDSANPFLRYLPQIPIEGHDLNPLLQDFALMIHPPILYMGYVGCAVPFAMSVALQIYPIDYQDIVRRLRPLLLLTWSFLTLGITLGSWWAYYELGWGGFWFWDPVENVSLMPWLIATALLHYLRLPERNKKPPLSFFLLTYGLFALSLIGTFLVRSGVLSSVHSFASDPKRGMYIGSVTIILFLLSFALLAWRRHLSFIEPRPFQISRDNVLKVSYLLLSVLALTVFWGTLYPLIHMTLFGQQLSVGAPYFNLIAAILGIPMMLGMCFGPDFGLKALSQQQVYLYLKKVIPTGIATLILTLIFISIYGAKDGISLLYLALSIGLMVHSLGMAKEAYTYKRKIPMVCGHFGVGLMVLGIVVSSHFSDEQDFLIKIGDTVKISHYEVHFANIKRVNGPNYVGHQAEFWLTPENTSTRNEINNKVILNPEKRFYLMQELAISETDISPGISRDIYIALAEKLDEGYWSVRIYYKPLIREIWLGALFMMLGGIVGVGLGGRPKA